MLKTIEEHALGDNKFFGRDKISMVDIAFGGLAYWPGNIEEVVGRNLLEAHRFPRLQAWTKKFKKVLEIRENLPDLGRMLKRET